MAEPGTDPLSPLAHDIIKAATYEKLVVAQDILSELLSKVTPDQLLTVPIKSYPHAYAMLAGLWLWHDCLDESHKISQIEPHGIPHGKPSRSSLNVRSVESVENDKSMEPRNLRDATESLAFWHAIIHRQISLQTSSL